jgi:hypothetical protein
VEVASSRGWWGAVWRASVGARRRMGTKDEAAGAVLGSRCTNQGRRRLCVWTGVSGVNQGRGIGG